MNAPPAAGVARAGRGDVEIAYEVFGPSGAEPLLLIAGVGVQMLIWHEDFCAALAERGFIVARFDNRDAGLSTHFAASGAPSVWRVMFAPSSSAAYSLDDMADDAIAVLDALGWDRAHVVGASMGGMIAQILAVRHPSRVRSLTSIMATPSSRIGTFPRIGAMRALMRVSKQHPADREAGEHMLALKRIMASPGYPLDEAWLRELGRRSYDRDRDEFGESRQRAAVAASGDRRRALAAIRVPALVIHGEVDPIMRPSGGRATAAAIPGARLVTFPAMGHDLPRALWPVIIEEIGALALRAMQADAAPDRVAR